MTNREIAKKIIDTENIAAKSFSNFRETDYGMLFYDEANPDSNDAPTMQSSQNMMKIQILTELQKK